MGHKYSLDWTLETLESIGQLRQDLYYMYSNIHRGLFFATVVLCD